MMSEIVDKPERVLTGRHVLAIAVGAFGIIIAVNVYMAVQAVGTFPGLEVANSYVASQDFDRDRAAQQALGWDLDYGYDAERGELALSFTDAAGLPVEVADLSVLLGRTTEAADDRRPDFALVAGRYVTPAQLDQGKWMMQVEAHAADGTLFRQRLDLFVGQ